MKKKYWVFLFLMTIFFACTAPTSTPTTTLLSTTIPTTSSTTVISTTNKNGSLTPTSNGTQQWQASLDAKETQIAEIIRTREARSTQSALFPPEAMMTSHCVEVLSSFPDDFKSNGIVIMESWELVDGRSTGDAYLTNMADMSSVLLSGEDRFGLYFAESPNKTQMAYFNVSSGMLDIASPNGEIFKTIGWEEGWVGIPGWLDNERVVINIAGLDPLESASRKADTLLALNPFNGERQVLSPDYPDIHTFDKLDWAGWSRTMYDPTLTRVIYLSEYENFSYVLWDLENEREIVRIPARGTWRYYLPVPRWAPDGTRFVVEGWLPEEERLELFQVSREGEVEQMTNLNPISSATLAGLSWSPDSRYLAGWLDKEEDPELELVVMDTQTKQITNYCLTIKYFSFNFNGSPPEPIWSPDGTQLLVMEMPEQYEYQVILVDLEQNISSPIAENMVARGWMEAP